MSENYILNYFIVFWSGVLVSFTPCVYPVIPIVASLIAGVNTTGTKLRGFVISLIYVLGLAITYSLLAVVAASTGKIFGQIQNHPAVFLIVGKYSYFFALALLDVIPLPFLGISLQNKIRLKSLWAVLLLGVASGLVVGP